MEKKIETGLEYFDLAIKEYPDYPHQTIRWIIPSPVGGNHDELTRALVPLVQEFLPRKTHVVIHNTNFPDEAVAEALQAEPDGYTWVTMTFPGHIISYLLGRVQYDLTKFCWLVRMSRDRRVLSVSKKSPFRNLRDLQEASVVRWPEKGLGSSDFVHDILQSHIMKINYSPVFGYKGARARIIAAVNGEADVMSTSYGPQERCFKTGELIPVVQHSRERDPRLPHVPTSVELGYPETVDVLTIDTLVALPPGVPRDVAEIIKAAFYRAVWDERYFERVIKTGISYAPLGSWETATVMEKQLETLERYKSVIEQVIDSVTTISD